MKRLTCILAAASASALLLAFAASAQAEDFGLHDFDVTFTKDAQGTPQTQAGAHPYAMITSFQANTVQEKGKPLPVEAIKDVLIAQIPGFVGNQTPVPPCSTLDFLTVPNEEGHDTSVPLCADGSAVGKIKIDLGPDSNHPDEEIIADSPVYLLAPAPGTAAKLGFWVKGAPVTADVALSESPPYNIVGASRNISQIVEFYGAELILWGDPASSAHDEERGACHENGKSCPAGVSGSPFLTLPTTCTGPLTSTYVTDSWQHPGAQLPNGEPDLSAPGWVSGTALTHDANGPSGFIDCGKLPFSPSITAQPTSRAAQSATGLDFSLDVDDPGLENADGLIQSEIKKAVITLPRGMSANPSLAEGLGVCSEAQLAAERSDSPPGAGCPEAAKIGTVEVETPLLAGKLLKGTLFIAKPYDNLAEDSLIALYIVIQDPGLGILVKQVVKVEPDPHTGQLIAISDEIPQLPFSHFRVHFREGARSPLISPPGCGAFTASAELTPWSGSEPITTTSAFQIISGPNQGPCPSGPAPFHPGFEAGTLNNAAGSYSPFQMHITRADGEQDITKFSAVLPPGVVGRIAAIPYCPEAGIAIAKTKTGLEERAAPSCPAASKVGRTVGGAGVGSELTYVPGALYLAGPFAGDPLSVVAITPAVAGPFDAGTIVVRVALTLNQTTGEVEVDGAASDPIPHILQGIPLNVRDLRVYTDRPNFTLNATSCEPSATRATLWGAGTSLEPGPEVPVSRSARYQAADCASLAFAPKLSLALKGGTRRGDHPALKSTLDYPPGPGYANVGKAIVSLPPSEFIDNAHIQNPCTRVQFNANACPKGSILGTAKATTPLLDAPLEGPVYFRSNGGERLLPDIVVDLHGLVRIVLVGHVDSKKGRIRTTFEGVPDAPVTKFTLDLLGGKRGLLVNNRNLCKHTLRASVQLTGQNGRRHDTEPVLGTSCKKAKKKAGKAKRGR